MPPSRRRTCTPARMLHRALLMFPEGRFAGNEGEWSGDGRGAGAPPPFPHVRWGGPASGWRVLSGRGRGGGCGDGGQGGGGQGGGGQGGGGQGGGGQGGEGGRHPGEQ